jgi:hypothetical protein
MWVGGREALETPGATTNDTPSGVSIVLIAPDWFSVSLINEVFSRVSWPDTG